MDYELWINLHDLRFCTLDWLCSWLSDPIQSGFSMTWLIQSQWLDPVRHKYGVLTAWTSRSCGPRPRWPIDSVQVYFLETFWLLLRTLVDSVFPKKYYCGLWLCGSVLSTRRSPADKKNMNKYHQLQNPNMTSTRLSPTAIGYPPSIPGPKIIDTCIINLLYY